MTLSACTLWSTPDTEQLHALLAKRRFVQSDAFMVAPNERWVAYSTTGNAEEPEGKILIGEDGVPCTVRRGEIRLLDLDGSMELVLGSDTEVCWRPSFSPDSCYMAYYSNRGGNAHLWIYDLERQIARQVSNVPIRPCLLRGDRPRWTPDSKKLLAWGRANPNDTPASEFKEERRSTPRLFSSYQELPKHDSLEDAYPKAGPFLLFDVASGTLDMEIPEVKDYRVIETSLSPTGQWLCHWSYCRDAGADYERLMLISLCEPGQSYTVTTKLLYDPHQDSFPRYLWHPLRDELFYIDGHELTSVAWDSKTRQWVSSNWNCSHQLGHVRDPFVFSSDGTHLYVGADGSLQGGYYAQPRCLTRISLATGCQRTIRLPEDLEYRGIVTSPSGTVWNTVDGQIAFHCLRGQCSEILLGHFDTGVLQTLCHGEPNERRSQLTILPNREMIIGVTSSITSCGNLMRYSTEHRPQKPLSDLNPQIEAALSCSVEEVWTNVLSATGQPEQVRMCVILPLGVRQGDRPPAIVSLYPGAAMAQEAIGLADAEVGGVPIGIFLQNGYAIVLPDLSLEGSSNPLHDTASRLIPQIEQACALGFIDRERLGVMGSSYGGYGSAGMAALTDLFKAGVCVAGLYDLPSCYAEMGGAEDEPWTDYFEAPNTQGRMGTHPWGALQRYLDNSPYYLAERITTPLLLVHGDADGCCPVVESRKMYVALKRLGKKVDLAIYPGEGHSIYAWGLRNSVDAARRILEFFDRHLQRHQRN